MNNLIWLVNLTSLVLLALPVSVESYHAPVVVEKPPIRAYAEEQANIAFSGEWKHFNDLINRESKWDSEAKNPRSTAYGLGQFLNSTWGTVGCVKTSDPYKQIDCTIKYVKQRYGTPHRAIVFHNKMGWY